MRNALWTAALGCIGSAACAQGEWTTLLSLPSAQQECGVATLLGRVYAVAGFDLATAGTARVLRYLPENDSWETMAPLPASPPLNHVGLGVVDGKMYAIGGLQPNFGAVSACFVYDPGTNAWSPIAPLALARGAVGVGVIDGRIYAAGGLPAARANDFAVYDPAMNQWAALPNMPTGRDHLAAGVVNGRFYALAGRLGNMLRNATEEYDPATNMWLARAPIPTARGGCAGAVVHGRIFVFGGEGNPADPNGVFHEVEAFDPVSNSWTVWADMPTARHGTGGATVGGRIIVPGGADVEGFGATAVNEAFTPCPGDADGDWAVGFGDLNLVLGGYGASGLPGSVAGDVNADGVVNFADLNIVLSRYGAAC